MEIKIINGYYWLYDCGGPVTDCEFVKIYRLNDNSNFYCLWPNDKCFHLYHEKRGYIGGASKYTFKEIRHYSEITHSFAAYRSDVERAHLIFEDGFMESNAFIEIGEECNDEFQSRPVKYTYEGERWCFYKTKKREYAWPKEKGYIISPDWSLAKRYPHSYYSLYHRNGFYEIAFYDENRNNDNKYFYFDAYKCPHYQFSSISLYQDFLVCQSKNNIFFVFDTKKKERYPLCSSIAEPNIKKGCIIISNGEHWQIQRKGKIVENYDWELGKKLLIRDQYVFSQNGNNNTWRIYSLDTGWEVFTDWNNIHIEMCDNDDIRLFVDTPSILQLERRIEHIAEAHKDWLSKIVISSKISECTQITHKTSSQNIVSYTSTEKTEKNDISNEKYIPVQDAHISSSNIESELPDHINYIIALNNVKVIGQPITNVFSDRKVEYILRGDIIIWYDKSLNVMYITRYKGHKTYMVLYIMKLDYPLNCLHLIPSKFTQMKLNGVTNNNLEQKIELYWKREEIDKQDFRLQKVNAFLLKLGFENMQIAKAIEALSSYEAKMKPLIKEDKYVDFTYNEIDYKLKPNDIWPIEFPFSRQKFLNKSNYIAILIGDNFNDTSYYEGADYEMIGQGKDKNFSQEFEHSPINKAIRDCSKRVLLFKRVDRFLTFYDEVESIGYDFIHEDEEDVLSRQLIKFYLRSLLRNKR